jgi:hypothetical protein
LQRLFTVFFLCNGSAIKGRDISSVGSNAYSLKATCYRAFRRRPLPPVLAYKRRGNHRTAKEEKGRKNWGLKGGKTVGFWTRNRGKTSAKPRQKTREENQSKEERKSRAQIQSNNTQRDGENKRAAIHRDEYWLCHCLRPCKQRKPRIKTNSQQERTNISSSSSSLPSPITRATSRVKSKGRSPKQKDWGSKGKTQAGETETNINIPIVFIASSNVCRSGKFVFVPFTV